MKEGKAAIFGLVSAKTLGTGIAVSKIGGKSGDAAIASRNDYKDRRGSPPLR